MNITNNFESRSRIWIFLHKDIKNEKWPEDYNSESQLKFFEKMSIKYQHPEMISFLKKELKNRDQIYSAENIFKLLCSFANDICPICGAKLRFKNLKVGFDTNCFNCKQVKDPLEIKTKKDVYLYLIQCHTGAGYISTLKKILDLSNVKNLFSNFTGNINSLEEIYLILTENPKGICKYCGKPAKFDNFAQRHNRAYCDFCSTECKNKMIAKRQKEHNTTNRMNTISKESMKQKVSEKIKEKIQLGIWTPCVTNSWAHSKIKLKYYNGNDLVEIEVRSSFEALFQLLNPSISYESLRILYYDSRLKKDRNYIVDFIDYDKKIVYEIKPSGEIGKRNNPDKFKALYNWANKNNYKVEIVTEEYFETHEFKISLLKECDQEYRDKLIKKLKSYKTFKINYEA